MIIAILCTLAKIAPSLLCQTSPNCNVFRYVSVCFCPNSYSMFELIFISRSLPPVTTPLLVPFRLSLPPSVFLPHSSVPNFWHPAFPCLLPRSFRPPSLPPHPSCFHHSHSPPETPSPSFTPSHSITVSPFATPPSLPHSIPLSPFFHTLTPILHPVVSRIYPFYSRRLFPVQLFLGYWISRLCIKDEEVTSYSGSTYISPRSSCISHVGFCSPCSSVNHYTRTTVESASSKGLAQICLQLSIHTSWSDDQTWPYMICSKLTL